MQLQAVIGVQTLSQLHSVSKMQMKKRFPFLSIPLNLTLTLNLLFYFSFKKENVFSFTPKGTTPLPFHNEPVLEHVGIRNLMTAQEQFTAPSSSFITRDSPAQTLA